MHGDLTTKNAIIHGDRLVLIDFGLSFISDRLEDRGEDIHLLKQAIKSSCNPRTRHKVLRVRFFRISIGRR